MLTHQIEPTTTALIAVDLQGGFVEGSPVAAPDAPEIVAKLNALAATCREAGALVVHTAHVIRPDVITIEPFPVEIDVTHGPCRGRTVVDQLRRTGQADNAHVATDVDAAAFIDLLTERISSLP